jgi:hypothetical protein
MQNFDTCLDFLRKLDWPRDQFCVAGSAALHLLSKKASYRGYEALLNREPKDIDVIVIGDALRRALDISDATHSQLERGVLLRFHFLDNKSDCLDMASAWPVGPAVKTTNDMRDITHEVDGIRVLREEFILELKQKLNRVKDHDDIQQIGKALPHKVSLLPTLKKT